MKHDVAHATYHPSCSIKVKKQKSNDTYAKRVYAYVYLYMDKIGPSFGDIFSFNSR